MESVLRQEESLWREGCVKRRGFEQEVKDYNGVMDDESSESTEEDDVTCVGRGQSETERLE